VIKAELLAGLTLVFGAVLCAQAPAVSLGRARLRWSEEATVISPSRLWQVEVHPVHDSENNETPVVLRGRAKGDSRALFTLQRDAELYWSSDSGRLLVVNAPLRGTNELLLFSVGGATAGAERPANALDRLVADAIAERLGSEQHIQSYMPAFVSWENDRLLLSVGGTAYRKEVGPLVSYCFGTTVDTATLRIQQVYSEKELRKRTGQGCRITE